MSCLKIFFFTKCFFYVYNDKKDRECFEVVLVFQKCRKEIKFYLIHFGHLELVATLANKFIRKGIYLSSY